MSFETRFLQILTRIFCIQMLYFWKTSNSIEVTYFFNKTNGQLDYRLRQNFENLANLPNQSSSCYRNLVILSEQYNSQPGNSSDNIETDVGLFFDSWKSSRSIDLKSFDLFDLLAKDTQCKLLAGRRINGSAALPWQPTRYCTYELGRERYENGMHMGYCIPGDCQDDQALAIGRAVAENIWNTSNDRPEVSEELQCVTAAPRTYVAGFYITLLITVALISLSVIATIVHLSSLKHETHEYSSSDAQHVKKTVTMSVFVKVFSMQNNFQKLLRRNADRSASIDSLHFFKVITMSLIILCHMYLFMRIFAKNLSGYLSYRGWIFWHMFYNSSYFAGTFFLISGVLYSYVSLKKLSPNRQGDVGGITKRRFSPVSWLCAVTTRYLRIIPLYSYCMLFVSYVLPYSLEYPPWYSGDTLVQCPGEIWRHMLFMNNFKSLQLCMPWTWYLAADFQLFLFFTPVVILLVYKPKFGWLICIILVLASCAARIVVMLQNNYPPALMLMLEIPQYNVQLANYAFEIYMKPWAWIPFYGLGLLVGYVVYAADLKRRPLNVYLRIVIWSLTVISLLWTPFGLYWNSEFGFKNAIYDSFYMGFNCVTWSLALGWIFLHSKHYSIFEILKKFYSMKIWLLLSNLTFGCYLVHIVFAFGFMYKFVLDKGGRPRAVIPYTDLYGLLLLTIFSSYLASFFLYLFVEGPAANFQRFLLKLIYDGKSGTKNRSAKQQSRIVNGIEIELLENIVVKHGNNSDKN